ncbi:MAG: hypothetical protein CMH62_02635 [Nanoarchaeota archaeon]|nr:hypothetical protein [Nanoarchaeota archaeon]
MNSRRLKKVANSFVFNRHTTPKKLLNLGLIFVQHQFIKNSKVKGYPIRLVIEPTNFCNLGCPLCPAGKDNKEHERGMMKLDEFKEVIDEVGDYLYEIDMYNFGESLLNRHVYDMIEYASKKNIATNLSTNLNVGDAERIVTSGLSKLIVSADGATNDVYKQYRVYGDFDNVLSRLKKVIAKKKELNMENPRIVWQFLTMKHNQHEVPKLLKLCKELGIEADIKPIRLNTAIDHEVKQDKTVLKSKWLPKVEKLKRMSYRFSRPKRVGPNSCLFLWNQAVINWDGIVTPCCAIFDSGKYKFGHVKEDGGFLKAWNSDTYQRSRRMVKHMDPEMEKDKRFDMCVGCIKHEFIDI